MRTAILEAFAETGIAPSPAGIAERLGSEVEPVLEAWDRLREGRAIVTGEDGISIRMANPFSGIPTEHTFESAGTRYYANCAWDALGIPAALGRGGDGPVALRALRRAPAARSRGRRTGAL